MDESIRPLTDADRSLAAAFGGPVKLEPATSVIPLDRINNDDWYVIDSRHRVVRQVGGRCKEPMPGPGQRVVTGSQAKELDPSISRVPAFLMGAAS